MRGIAMITMTIMGTEQIIILDHVLQVEVHRMIDHTGTNPPLLRLEREVAGNLPIDRDRANILNPSIGVFPEPIKTI